MYKRINLYEKKVQNDTFVLGHTKQFSFIFILSSIRDISLV